MECLIEAAPECTTVRDLYGDLPLHAAAASGVSAKVIKRLLDVQPEAISAAANNGMLPVHKALELGRCLPGTVLLLLNWDPSAACCVAGDKDHFPLSMAVPLGEPFAYVVEWLLDENAAAARHRDADGQLPLHLIFGSAFLGSCHPSLQIVRLLLNYFPGAAGEMEGRNQRLPLHMAAAIEGPDAKAIVHTLLLCNPEAVSEPDKQGHLPFDMAVASASPALPVLLAAMPQAAERVDSDGRLPLHHLVRPQSHPCAHPPPSTCALSKGVIMCRSTCPETSSFP